MNKCAVIVSCDQSILASCRPALARADFELVLTADAGAVVKTLVGAQPELILLDLDLCRGVAAEVLHWIGAREPLPHLVLVSSGENLGVLREGFVVPDFQLVIKPLREDEIQAALDATSRPRSNARNSGDSLKRALPNKGGNGNG